MSIVFVLDCSESIGDEDFRKLKNSAIKFIETFAYEAPSNSVHIGIVGFNSMKNTDKNIFSIKPLNNTSIDEMKNFINNLEMQNNTALYYAMNKSIIMLDNYSSKITKNYQGSFVVTFTDGYDNNSMDAKIGAPAEGKADPYFLHVRDKQLKKKIKDENIKSYVIAVPGEDVGDNKAMFQSILKDLADPDKFIMAENFDVLNKLFENIANELLNQWMNLKCYVPPRFKGKVRWTLDEGDVYEKPIEKPIVPVKNIKTTKNYLKSTLFAGYLGIGSSLTYGHRLKNPKISLGINTLIGVVEGYAYTKDNQTTWDYYYFIPNVFFQYSYILNKSDKFSVELYSSLGTYFAIGDFTDFGTIIHPIGINFGFHKIGFDINMLFVQGIDITCVGMESGFYVKF